MVMGTSMMMRSEATKHYVLPLNENSIQRNRAESCRIEHIQEHYVAGCCYDMWRGDASVTVKF